MSNEPKNQFYVEIARISAILLSAILAMMVFMLIVGVQSPDTNIKPILFTALITLGASLVVSVFGNILSEWAQRSLLKVTSTKKSEAKELRLRSEKIVRRLGIFRIFQQTVFIISVISVVLLALAVTQFLYKPAPAQPPSTSQPTGTSSGQQSPGESAEDHAKEGSASPQTPPASPAPAP